MILLKKSYILFAILFIPFLLFAQDKCELTIKGRVLDSDTQLPLAGSSIYLVEKEVATQADGHGYFSFQNICTGDYTIEITNLGFETSVQTIHVTAKDESHTFFMEHEGVVLHDVNVVGHQPTLRTTAANTTLGQEELNKSKGEVLAEILQDIPGVTMMQTGATIAKPVIHGMHSNRVLMVNNGIKQEGQQWGAEHAPEIDPFIASEITVIKGAESVKYGAEAIGGVILVEPSPLPINGGLSGSVDLVGSTNGRVGTASAMLESDFKPLPGLSWRVQGTLKKGGNLQTADYYLNNTGIRESNYSAALSYRKSKLHLDAYYSHFNTDLGIFEGAHVGSVDDLNAAIDHGRPFTDGAFTYDIDVPRQSVIHDLVKLKIHKDLNEGTQLDIQYGFQRNARQEYDTRRGDRSSIPALDLVLNSHSLDVSYDRINANSLRSLFGINATAIISNNIPGTMATPIIPNYDSYGFGAFVVERLVKEKYDLEAGIRYDFKTLDAAGYRGNEFYGGQHDFHNVSGSLGILWRFHRDWNLKSNLGLSWRPPTVNELYSDGLHHGSASIEVGDNNLKSEQGYKWINTLSYSKEKLRIELNGYAHYLKNYIYLNPTGEVVESLRGAFPVFHYEQTDALFMGADLTASYQLPYGFLYGLKGSYLYADDLEATGNLPMIPSNRLDNKLQYARTLESSRFSDFFIEAQLQTVFEQTRYNKESDFTPAPATYNLVNINAGTKIKLNEQTVGIHVSANNLLNVSYKEYMNRFRYYAHDLGRNISLRLSYNF